MGRNRELILVLLIITMLTGILFPETDVIISPISDCDFKVISNDGKVLWLLENIDSVLNKFSLDFDGILEHETNSELDYFEYSNDNIAVGRFRAWDSAFFITLKDNGFSLNRNVRVGDSIESIYANFLEDEIFKMKEGLYVVYSSGNEESKYYYPPTTLFFRIEKDIITEITLRATYD